MDVVRELETLRRRLDDAKVEAAKVEERARRARADYEQVVEEMEAQGVTEATIKAEVERLTAELEGQVEKVKAALDDVEGVIKNGGKNVATVEATISDIGF